MKNLCTMVLSFFLSGAIAQNSFNCISHEHYVKQLNNPEFRKNQAILEQETQNATLKLNKSAAAAPAYIIPVVFHVIYTTAQGNISDAQIKDQIAILNEEFNRLQPDTILTPGPFKALAAPFSVEFRLATIDPDGNCTNGINRLYNTLTNCSYEEDDVKALSYWPSNMYLNIWITQSMHYSGSMDCVGGGYATFPGGPANLDGINIRGDLISNIGTAATNSSWGNFKGRYLIHELGHWFNLRHIWGDANCGNDFVSDTPPAENSNSGCPTFPHNAFSPCAGSNADGEMFTNYMDYTNGPCLNMFTAGQVTRMTTCINSAVSGRSNLWSNSNLNATGTNNPYTHPVVCVSTPGLLQNGTIVVCKGDSARLTDNSYGGLSTSRNWDFPGGSANSLTDSIVKVRYDVPGLYTVGLTKNYLGTSKTTTFVNKVQVLDNVPNTNYVFPFQEDFEYPASFNSDWVIVNGDNDERTWQWTDTTSYTGMSSVRIMNFGKAAPLTDDLISPAYDLSSVLNPTLTFRMHYTNQVTANYDKLTVYISNNCGKTWQQIYTRSGANLKTIPSSEMGSYVPEMGSSEWRLEKANIANSWANGIVRFKFSFTSGGGNNIFMDDININGISTTGLPKNYSDNTLEVFPNPASENIRVNYSFHTKNVRIEVLDVLGKVCLFQVAGETEGTETIDLGTLKNGVYFIRLKDTNGTIYSTKFIKQGKN